jgi:hypothetical protein
MKYITKIDSLLVSQQVPAAPDIFTSCFVKKKKPEKLKQFSIL